MSKVGFIGLGAMGSRMARNILSAGFEVAVWNRSDAPGLALEGAGARRARSPRDAAADAGVVLAMVTDDQASKRVWTDGADGALAGMKPGAVAVEMSTLTPAWLSQLAEAAAGFGVKLLDAPVSGTLPQAEAAQLVEMVGGDAEAFEAAKPVLAAMGSPNHVGPNGHGALLKLAVNALLGIQVAAWAELMGFLAKNGMETARALQVLTATSLASPAGAGYAKMMAAHDFAPRFTNALLAKDLRYLHATADKVQSRTPISDAASAVFDVAARQMGAENVSAVIRLYQK